MNILIITAVGGFLEKFLLQDVHMLMNRGHAVHYASNFENPVYECDKAGLEAMGVKCYQIPVAKSPAAISANLKAYKKLRKIVKEEQIDAVYLHNPMGGVLGRLLTFAKKDLKVVYTAHGFHFYKGAPIKNWLLFYTVERWLARRTDVLITINSEDRALAEKFRLRKGGRVVRIPGTGIDTDRFHPDKNKRERLRNKFGIENNEFIFLSVGELNENKNHETIINAFAKADLQNAKLLICGEGPKHRNLENHIHKLGLDNKVVCMGYRTNVEELYILSDVFLFPSVREGLGMAAIEAMACGLPLIVADNRGSREYAGENAIICDATDTEAFAKAMKELAVNEEKCSEMSAKSIEAAAEFSKAKTMAVIEEIFQRLENGSNVG